MRKRKRKSRRQEIELDAWSGLVLVVNGRPVVVRVMPAGTADAARLAIEADPADDVRVRKQERRKETSVCEKS